jgi:hypothetical protein
MRGDQLALRYAGCWRSTSTLPTELPNARARPAISRAGQKHLLIDIGAASDWSR